MNRTRTGIDRRQAIVRLGATALTPFVASFHPLVPPQPDGFAPRFLDENEVELVSELAERIIPETDTPGARGALVHQYIDFVLFQAESSVRERFRSGLEGLESYCRTSFGSSFLELGTEGRDELLVRFFEPASREDAALVAFVEELKRLTVEGYYRSEPGMRQEIGFDGNVFLTEFDGCTHEEHRRWKPEV